MVGGGEGAKGVSKLASAQNVGASVTTLGSRNDNQG